MVIELGVQGEPARPGCSLLLKDFAAERKWEPSYDGEGAARGEKKVRPLAKKSLTQER